MAIIKIHSNYRQLGSSIESKFDVNGITDDKLKFNYVVANLDSNATNKIRGSL